MGAAPMGAREKVRHAGFLLQGDAELVVLVALLASLLLLEDPLLAVSVKQPDDFVTLRCNPKGKRAVPTENASILRPKKK